MMDLWLMNAIGDVDADLVERAALPPTVRAHRTVKWTAAVAAMLVLAVSVGVLFGNSGSKPPVTPDASVSDVSQTTDDTTITTEKTTTTTAQKLPSRVFAMATPSYPALASPDFGTDEYWEMRETEKQKRERLEQNVDGMSAFYAGTMTALLRDGTENRVFSPLNLYLALSVLAETTAGDSRQQILDLLGQEDVTALRDKTNALWEGLYRDDELVTCRFGNSLWLRNDNQAVYNEDILATLAQQYYAAAYRGEMGSDDYNGVLRDWINDHTGGLLSQQVENVKLNPNTALALVSTLYFRGGWIDEFEEIREGIFHAADGDVTCSMMYREMHGWHFWGDRFTGTSIGMKDGPSMYIFLPNECESVESLLGDPQVMAVIQGDGPINEEGTNVRMTVPRFDIATDLDLKESLSRLGVTDVFDAEKADFSGILAEQDGAVTLDRIRHATRVTVDEKGVTAGAFVEMDYGLGGYDGWIDFVVDRPFLFTIQMDGTLLFAGIVETPQ